MAVEGIFAWGRERKNVGEMRLLFPGFAAAFSFSLDRGVWETRERESERRERDAARESRVWCVAFCFLGSRGLLERGDRERT